MMNGGWWLFMRRLLFAAAFLSLFSISEGYAQSQSSAIEKTVPASADVPVVKKEEPAAPAASVVPVAEPKKTEVVKAVPSQFAVKKEPVKAESVSPPKTGEQVSLFLSEFNDGDFRSMRIPGFVPDKKNLSEAVTPSAPVKSEAPDPGKSKRRATLLVWGTLIAMIIVIVALYRYSRKKRHRKVFRSIR
jgi:hypothetical protein